MKLKATKTYSIIPNLLDVPLRTELALEKVNEFIGWFRKEHPKFKNILIWFTVNDSIISLGRGIPVDVDSKLTFLKSVLNKYVSEYNIKADFHEPSFKLFDDEDYNEKDYSVYRLEISCITITRQKRIELAKEIRNRMKPKDFSVFFQASIKDR